MLTLPKTIELILTKFGIKYLKGMGIKVCAIQGAGPFWDPERGYKYNMGNFGYQKNIPLKNQWPRMH